MDKAIIGLGNLGKKYHGTRHNAGFQAVDFLAEQGGVDHFTSSSHAEAVTATAIIGGQKVLLVKPQTFMNESGQAVQSLINYFGINSEDVLIIHDDVDLPFGELRVSFGSSAGGHNGVRSVIKKLNTKDFVRLRVGISPATDGKVTKPEEMSVRDFVLQRFSSEEQDKIDTDIKTQIKELVAVWGSSGRQAAMNQANGGG